MTDILFGQSYYLRFDPKLWEAMQPYPPLGTLYAAAFVRARGYDVALFDAMLADSEQRWAKALDHYRPRFAVLFEDNFNYLSKMCLLRMREAAFAMAAMARERGCTVIACGADATDHAADYFQRGVDYVLLGEGEATLADLLDSLAGRSATPPTQIPGLSYPHSSLTIHNSQFTIYNSLPRPPLRDLDSLPRPAWDLVDVAQYRQIWLERHGYTSMNLATTRGCPYHCNWCAKPIWGQRYASRSPENVAAEMRWLKDTYRPDHISFVDDIMGLKPGWMERFADEVERQEARIPFKCLSRVDLLLRPGEIDALRRAGAQIVWVGAESGSQKILDAMEKGTTVEQIYEASRRLHAAGIQVAFFLQFGYPGETRADIELTLQMVRDCQPDDIGMSVSYPLPGTPFYERVRNELGAKQNWQDSSDLAMLYQGPYATEFYRQLHAVLHKEFRAHKTWQTLTQRSNAPRPSPRQLFAMVYQRATLPLARRKLARLEAAAHQGLGSLGFGMSQQAAATPSPQDG
ncbi:MAG TPA: radical SAM protein [Anaerolineae bacterium]|nr:radical SAM protein [Anaerolineae bacterium]